MASPIVVDDQTIHPTRRWAGAALTCLGALGLLGAMRLAWFELRLYSWQGGGCCDRDIDNPYVGLTPWPWDSTHTGEPELRLAGSSAYLAIAVVAVIAIVGAAWITFGRTRQTPTAYLLVGCGLAVGVLVALATVLAFNVGVPTSYGDGVVDVRMVPMWGLLAGILGAVAIVGGGVLAMLSNRGR